MKQNLLFLLMLLLPLGASVNVKANVPANDYHTVTLEVSPGIDLYQLTPGVFTVEDGDHLYFQFYPKYPELGAKDIIFQIDGVDTKFKDFGGRYYYSYILSPITKDHKVLISLGENTVTLPEVEGARMMPDAGKHKVAYGESFRFSILPDEPWTAEDVNVYANGELLAVDLESPSIMIYPAPLNYILNEVKGPVEITVEKLIAKDSTIVTLPELEGARMSPSAGEHKVAVGDSFRFSILPHLPQNAEEVEVYANDVRLEIDPDAPSLMIYPEPLNYLIEKVTGPITVTVKNLLVEAEIEEVDPNGQEPAASRMAPSNTRVYSANGQLIIESAEKVEVRVYDVSGALQANRIVKGNATISLAPRIYIVKAGDQVSKVAVTE